MKSPEELLSTAIAAHHAGDLAQAAEGYREVLSKNPTQVDAMHYLGVALAQAGDLNQAEIHLKLALTIAPRNPEILQNLSGVLMKLGQLDAALVLVDKALSIDATSMVARATRASILAELGRFEEALECYSIILRQDAGDPGMHVNLGNTLLRLQRLDAALKTYDQALFLSGANAPAYLGQATVYREAGKLHASLSRHHELLRNDSRDLNSWIAKASVERALKYFKDASGSIGSALALSPTYPEARWNSALIRLNLGDWKRGFTEYESRLDWREYRQLHPDTHPCPLLPKGVAPRGKRILVHAEQGLGDSLQFCRFVPSLIASGAQVVFLVPKALLKLLKNSPQLRCEVVSEVPLQGFDYRVPLMSLPNILGATVESVPFSDKPYLFAETSNIARWQEELGAKKKPRVGVVWSGGQGSKLRNRSIELRQFSQIFDLDFDWVSLQKELLEVDAPLLPRIKCLRHYGAAQQSFADTAAMIASCDLVISVDTSVAHLAGAMAKPTWILLPHIADWRWLEGQDRSVWYPQVRLFRQPREGCWRAVLQQVQQEIRLLSSVAA